MNKKTRKLLTWCLVFSMILTQILFTNVAFAVNRYSGADRYQTALEVVKAGWKAAETAVIARGDDLADALAAAPLAYAKGKAPILLTETKALPVGVLEELTVLGVKTVYIVGGTGAVSADVEKALAEKFGASNVIRISGADRVATSLEIAKAAFPEAPTEVVLAGAYANADALSISPIAAFKGMPVLLVNGTMSADVAAYVAGKTAYAVGGTGVLADAALPEGTKRLAGDNRYGTNAAILKEFAEELDYTTVYLAKGTDDNMVDSLAGAALAAITKSPIVFADENNSVAAASGALKAGLKDASTVIALGGAAAVPDSAIAAVENLKPSVPAELAVKSVTADNLKQILVTFNRAISDEDTEDAVEDEKNYTIKDYKGRKVSDAIDSVSLDSDKKVATITLNDNNDFSSRLKNQEEYSLILDADILGTEKTEKFTPNDTELPTAESAKVVGINTIKVVFDEPLRPASKDGDDLLLDKKAFEVNGGKISIKKVMLVADNKEANVVLYSDLEDKQELTLKVKAEAEDYAGYTTKAASFNMTVAEDTEKPYVVGFEDADRAGVTLIFNEDIQGNTESIVKNKDIYHTNSKNPVKTCKIDGSKLELTWDDENKLPAGTAYVYIDSETIQDLWENDNDHITAKISIDEDNTKPAVKSIEQGDNTSEGNTTIKVTYTEKVKSGTNVDESGENKDNYTVKDKDGDIQKIKEVKLNSDKDKATITMKETLDPGEYTVEIKDVEDIEGNTIDDYSGKVTIEDKDQLLWDDVEVSLYDAGTDDQRIVVDFGEEMTVGDDKYAVDDIEKYILKARAKITDSKKGIVAGKTYTWKVEDLFDADIEAIRGNERVQIDIPYDDDEIPDAKNLKDDYSEIYLIIARVADKEGNITDDLMSPELLVSPSTRVAYDTKPRAIETDTIKFVYKDVVDFESDDYKFGYDEDTDPDNELKLKELTVSKLDADDDDGETVVLVTLDEELTYDGFFKDKNGVKHAVYVVVKENPESKNSDGAPVVSGAIKVTDKIAPAIAETDDYKNFEDGEDLVHAINYGGEKAAIIIEMEENIDNATLSRKTFEIDDYTVADIYASDLRPGSGKQHFNEVSYSKYVVIEVEDIDEGEEIEDGFGITQTAGLEDANGNEVTELDTEVLDVGDDLSDFDLAPAQAPISVKDAAIEEIGIGIYSFTGKLTGAEKPEDYTVKLYSKINSSVLATADVKADGTFAKNVTIGVVDALAGFSYKVFKGSAEIKDAGGELNPIIVPEDPENPPVDEDVKVENAKLVSIGIGFFEFSGKLTGSEKPEEYNVKLYGRALKNKIATVEVNSDGTFKADVQLSTIDELVGCSYKVFKGTAEVTGAAGDISATQQ